MLINCAAYRDGRKVAEVKVEDISDYLQQPGCFVWLALKDPDEAELRQAQHEFGLHELAVEDAEHGHQRPKIEEYGDSLFAVLKLVEPSAEGIAIGEIDVFVGTNYVLSVRTGSQQNFLGVRERCEREPELLKHGPGYVLYALMDTVVDRYFPIIELIESDLEEVERLIFTEGNARLNIQRLYELKRRVTVLKHAVAPLAEVAGKLHGGRVPPMCLHLQEYFRDVLDHLLRINASIESVRDTIATAITVNLSMVTIADGEVTKRLAAWASIFAIATALVGVWGMNFEHMPELKWTYGYPFALGVIAAIGGVLYWRFKRSGWL